MRWVRFVNISKKVCFQETPENAKTQSWVMKTVWSTGPQQRNTDDHNCPVDTAEGSFSSDWRTVAVDDWWRQLFARNFH